MCYTPRMDQKVVSYIRVSTVRQGQSGLGLSAQRTAVDAFCRANDYELLEEFKEVESGRKNDRPVLQTALAFAKEHGAILVIARLDRLARNVAFIANLMEVNVEFRACDLPFANKFVLHVMSAVGQQQAEAISKTTKDALADAKRDGKLLGASNPKCHSWTSDDRRKAVETRRAKAATDYANVLPHVRQMRQDGLSLAAIVQRLDEGSFKPRKAKAWNAMTVSRLLRYDR
jgi:DNA invertase Pin-like site-specific DNA recombinase